MGKMSEHTEYAPEYQRCGEFDRADQVRFHEHSGTELILLTSGSCEIDVDGMRLAGQTGDLFVIPARTRHNQINPGRVSTRYVIFRKGSRFKDDSRVIGLSGDVWVARWFDELFRLQSENHGNMTAMGTELVRLILWRLAEIEEADRQQDTYSAALRRALAFLDRNFTNPAVGLAELAAAGGVCPEYLCSLFQRHLGRSPVASLLEMRLDYAMHLLDDPYLSVKEVSLRSGFNDANYFARRFRQRFGDTPSEHRLGGNREKT